MSGWGPNGRILTIRLIEMAAVCQPDAASPLSMVFLAAISSKWNGCGSNSAANRVISSLVTGNSPVLKRIPNARSSNHSIIFPHLRAQFDQARSFEQPEATGKGDFPQPG